MITRDADATRYSVFVELERLWVPRMWIHDCETDNGGMQVIAADLQGHVAIVTITNLGHAYLCIPGGSTVPYTAAALRAVLTSRP